MPVDLLIGRSLALCLHPTRAWPRLSPVSRLVLVAVYFASAYAGVLAALLAF